MSAEGLLIELIDPVSFSLRAATAGGHATLDRIPGAALLGLCAAEFYNRPVAAIDPWLAFHSGHVRFGDGIPAGAGKVQALPMPRCWHGIKSADPARSGDLINLAEATAVKGVQYAQKRDGYVVVSAKDGKASFEILKPVRTENLKTAIDATTGTAATGLLFGQESLAPNQAFIAAIAFDPSAQACAAALLEFLCAAGKVHRIGRSSSAEYGRVRISKIVASALPACKARIDRVVVWCLSDVILNPGWEGRDIAGAMLGIKAGKLIPARSFLAMRRFTPFNGKWQKRDGERVALAAGSIMVFEPEKGHAPFGAMTIGMDQQLGFGRILVNADVLRLQPVEVKVQAIVSTAPADVSILSASPLGRWMIGQASLHFADTVADDWHDYASGRLKEFYRDAKKSQGTEYDARTVPTRTQWQAVRECAKNAATDAELKAALFQGANAAIPANDAQWSRMSCQGKTFRENLATALDVFIGKAPGKARRVLMKAIDSLLNDFETTKKRDKAKQGDAA